MLALASPMVIIKQNIQSIIFTINSFNKVYFSINTTLKEQESHYCSKFLNNLRTMTVLAANTN